MKNLYKSFLIVLLISSYSALKGATEGVDLFATNNMPKHVLEVDMMKSDDPILVTKLGDTEIVIPGFFSAIPPMQKKQLLATIKAENLVRKNSTILSMTIGIPRGLTPPDKYLKLEFRVTKKGTISYTITGNQYSSIKDKKNSKEGIWHSPIGAVKISAVMTMKGPRTNKPKEFNLTVSEPTVAEIAKSFE